MIIGISFESLYLSRPLYNYFFRKQSRDTLEELIRASKLDRHHLLELIDSYAAQNCYDIDDIDEILYDEVVEEIAKEIGIELKDSRSEEEEEEE